MKYKIYVSLDLRNKLENDAELFEFLKNDESVNLNAFLNTLIVNYFDIYVVERKSIEDTIKQTVIGVVEGVDDGKIEIISNRVYDAFCNGRDKNIAKKSVITLTANRRTMEKIEIMENKWLRDSSLSGLISDLLASYISYPRHKRELVIFSEKVETIDAAIKNATKISFTSTSAGEKIFSMYPYEVMPGKEEQFNYLYGVMDDGEIHSFRLSRMQHIYDTHEKFDMDLSVASIRSALSSGVPINKSYICESKIKLSDEGKRKYRMVTSNRPELVCKEGDIYSFRGSLLQIEEYFKRFGAEAIVMEPEMLKIRMVDFHKKALKEYGETM